MTRFSPKAIITCTCVLFFLVCMPATLMAESPAKKSQVPEKSGSSAQQSDTVGEISIVGSTDLPTATYSLPWRLPSVEKREDESPPREISGVLVQLEPKRHRQQIYFDRYLDVEMPSYNVK